MYKEIKHYAKEYAIAFSEGVLSVLLIVAIVAAIILLGILVTGAMTMLTT